MGKSFKLVLALIVALFSVPVFGSAVFAADTLKDGTYELEYVIKHETEDKTSSADRFFVKPATLTVENGTKNIEIKIQDQGFISYLAVPSGEVEIVREDEKSGSFEFQLDSDLSEEMEMEMTVDTPMGSMDHVVRVFFTVPTVEEAPVEETPVTDEETPVTDETDDAVLSLEDGFYTLTFDALHAEKDEPSAMARFMVNSAFVASEADAVEVTIAVANQTVTKLQLNGLASVDSKVEGETRYGTFVFESLPTDLDGYVEYQAPFRGSAHHGQADFRVVLDEASVEVAEEGDKYAAEYVAAPRPTPGNEQEQPAQEEETGEEQPVQEEEEVDTEETVTEEKVTNEKNQFTADKAYTINSIVKHEVEDKASAADQFFKKPAVLLENNGEKYIQLTVTNSNMIDSLSTANGDVVIVKENSDGSMVVQFKVTGDLSEPVIMDMHITVPGMYSTEHTTRLFFDVDNQTEVAADNYTVANSTTDNGQAVNPQTGDQTNILLYVLLLVGSAVPLVFMLRKRFA